MYEAVLFLPNITSAVGVLQTLATVAAPLGLKLSWSKTKLQSLSSGPSVSTVSVDNT